VKRANGWPEGGKGEQSGERERREGQKVKRAEWITLEGGRT
jgi:hypothetical protein